MMDPGSAKHDSDEPSSGRSKDADEMAMSARDAVRHDKTFTTNSSDPGHENTNPQGNPDSPSYNRSRKLGG